MSGEGGGAPSIEFTQKFSKFFFAHYVENFSEFEKKNFGLFNFRFSGKKNAKLFKKYHFFENVFIIHQNCIQRTES